MATISKSQLYSVRWEVTRVPSQRAELSGYDGGSPLVLYEEPPEKCAQKVPSSSAQRGQTGQKVGKSKSVQKPDAFVLCVERASQSTNRDKQWLRGREA
jgi:hypothetical protein